MNSRFDYNIKHNILYQHNVYRMDIGEPPRILIILIKIICK